MANEPLSPVKTEYISAVDGRPDWYLTCHAGHGRDCVVVLHGHGGHGDQLFTRADMGTRRQFLHESRLSIITPNLRDNAWMNPAAVADLAEILRRERERMQYRNCFFVSGSMGGTGALIFAALHPELVDALVVLGAATDIRRYRNWCAAGTLPIHGNIKDAIDEAYDEAAFAAHNVCALAGNLTMPLRFFHSLADRVIPVSEMQTLRTVMAGRGNAEFVEVKPLSEAPQWWSDHDAPLQYFESALKEFI